MQKKTNANLIQSYDNRLLILKSVLNCVCTDLNFNILPLSDQFGPSLDPVVDILIVSKETENGGNAVIERRKDLQLSPTELIVLDVIAENQITLSSTQLRDFELQVNNCEYYIRSKWNELMSNLNIQTDYFEIILRQYKSGLRSYHYITHLSSIFKIHENLSLYPNSIIIPLSVFFHDLIYDVQKLDNEERSAI